MLSINVQLKRTYSNSMKYAGGHMETHQVFSNLSRLNHLLEFKIGGVSEDCCHQIFNEIVESLGYNPAYVYDALCYYEDDSFYGYIVIPRNFNIPWSEASRSILGYAKEGIKPIRAAYRKSLA